ncbi:MAG TPA: ATP-binding protein [Longimicrobiales bacterium]
MAAVHGSKSHRWLRPAFGSEELTERARLLHRVTWIGLGAATLTIGILVVAQPSASARALTMLAGVLALGALVLAISVRGRPREAAVLAVAGMIVIVTALAPSGGGIRSPGVTMYFAFVLLAGVLIGPRGALRAALACALLATTLAVLELSGVIRPRRLDYGPVALLVLNLFYMGMVVALTRVASRSMTSALRRAEAELTDRRDAESRLAMALDAGGIGVWEHVADSGEYRFDRRAFAMFGLPRSADGSVTMNAVRERIHPQDARVIGTMSGLTGGRTAAIEHRVVHPDGTVRHLSVVGRSIPAAGDAPARVIGMVTDVTERKEAELERERLVRDLRERVKELTLLRNVARLLNARLFFDRSLLGEIVRQMPSAWMHDEHCEARIRYDGETYATPGWRETPWTQSRAFETSTASGVIEVAYTQPFPAVDEGPFLAEERALLDSLAEMLVGHLESEHIEQIRRGLEGQLRQAQKMEALGTLAGGIAHDFNNILTAIGGNVDLALLETKEAEVRTYLREVKEAHERARDLVKRILVFSRRQEALKDVVPLQPVVEEALRLIRASLGSNIRVETKFARDLPPILADSTQIHQVLMNLATNAAYAMSEKGGVLTVALDECETCDPLDDGLPAELEPGRYVRLSMRDTGIGMGPDVRERLFEPFFTTKGVRGTGLGLSVVHGIVHEHGGAIRVESQPGRGTLFQLYFPATAEPADAPIVPPASTPLGAGERILCVDDEEAVLFVMTRMLERIGYRAIGCSDPVEALEKFRAAPNGYDAVITDMGMPRMNGVELARALRDIRPHIPIAIASGYGRPPEAPDVDAWISKPPSRDQLARTLDEMLAHAARAAPGP